MGVLGVFNPFSRGCNTRSQPEEEFREGFIGTWVRFVEQNRGAVALISVARDRSDIGGRTPRGQVRGILEEVVQAR